MFLSLPTVNAIDIMHLVAKAGVHLRVNEEGCLVARAPRGQITGALRDAIAMLSQHVSAFDRVEHSEKASGSFGETTEMNESQRVERLGELRAELFATEVQEERAIFELEASGMPAPARRGDASAEVPKWC
jgi:hypothetical protein